MTQEEDLLQAICDQPGDDTLRLIYADWLEEHGSSKSQQARSEFIRLQVQVANLAMEEPERLAFQVRADALEEEHGKDWAKPISRLAKEHTFRRGFIEEVTLSVPRFLRDASRLRQLTPLRKVKLHSVASHLQDLLKSPSLEGIEGLDLSGQDLGDDAVRQLTGCPHLRQLRELNLRSNQLRTPCVRHLARSPHLTELQVLDLGYNAIGDGGVRALARSPQLANLIDLRLSFNEIRMAGVRALAQGPHWELQALDLGGNRVGPAEAQVLADSSALRDLTRLDLRFSITEIQDPGMEALAASPYLHGLTYLDLSDNSITEVGAQALADSPAMSHLVTLDLYHNHIEDGGAIALAQSPYLTRLWDLNLIGNRIGNQGARALADSPNLTHLVHFHLTQNNIDRPGVRALLHSPHLSSLRSLYLNITADEKTKFLERYGTQLRISS